MAFLKLYQPTHLIFQQKFWPLIFAICAFCLILSHFFFQVYLNMRPCELCVYLRLDLFLIAFGALLGALSALKLRLQILAFGLCFYGLIFGILHALKLRKIHTTLSGDAFNGLSGCKMLPEFPLNLALHEHFPSLFLPTGPCGLDAASADASALQAFFAGLYSQGWYLIPQWKFLTMPECLLGIFALFFGLLAWKFLHLFRQDKVAAALALILSLFLSLAGRF